MEQPPDGCSMHLHPPCEQARSKTMQGRERGVAVHPLKGERSRCEQAIGQKNQVRGREKSGKYLMLPGAWGGKLILLIERGGTCMMEKARACRSRVKMAAQREGISMQARFMI